MSKLIGIMALFVFANFLYAGTVTLTGSCYHQINSNMIYFNISNSGNDTAYNPHIIPFIQNVKTNETSYIMSNIPPGGTDTVNITMENITANGSYGDYFLVAYQQGSSVFTATFPCLITFGKAAESQLLLSYVESYSRGNYTINVTATNAGTSPVQANFSLILSPGISHSRDVSNVYIKPFEVHNALFNVYFNGSADTSYSGAVVANYNANGTNFAAMTNIVLASVATGQHKTDYTILIYAIVIIIIVVLVLRIILVRMKGKKA